MLIPKYPLMAEAEDEPQGGAGVATEDAPASDSPDPENEGDSELENLYNQMSTEGDADDLSGKPEGKETATDDRDDDADDHSGDRDEEMSDGHDDGPEVADDASAFDDDLLDRARLLGFSDADLEVFDSPQQLERTLLVTWNRLNAGAAQAPEAPAPEPAEPAPAQQPPQQSAEELKGWRKEFRDTEQFEPYFGEFADEFDSVKSELAELRELKQEFDQQRAREITGVFDDNVDGLGEFFGDIYGSRGEGELTPTREQKRLELFQKVAALGGAEGLRNKALLKQAAVALNAQEYEKHIARSTSAAVRKNGKKRLRRSGSASTTKSPTTPELDAEGRDADLISLYEKMSES